MVSEMDNLRVFLADTPPGPVEDRANLLGVLVPAWADVTGSSATNMHSGKLDRMMKPGVKKPEWNPPVLTFRVERHGGMVGGGSSRAEIQEWTVDVDKAEATVEVRGHRQMRPMQSRLDVAPLAAETVSRIEGGVHDERLKWSADRSRVTVVIGLVIPDSGPKQTVAARRKRFKKMLAEALVADGWREVTGTSPNTWERADT